MKNISELIHGLSEATPALVEIVNNLFGVSSDEIPKPNVIFASTSRLPLTSVQELQENSQGLPTLYFEPERTMVLDPHVTYHDCAAKKQAMGADIELESELKRNFSMSYGRHVHSYLQGFTVVQQQKELSESNPGVAIQNRLSMLGDVISLASLIEYSQQSEKHDDQSDKHDEQSDDWRLVLTALKSKGNVPLDNKIPLVATIRANPENTDERSIGLSIASAERFVSDYRGDFKDLARHNLNDAIHLSLAH